MPSRINVSDSDHRSYVQFETHSYVRVAEKTCKQQSGK